MTKSNMGGKGLFQLITVWSHTLSLMEVRARLEAGAEAETIEECCLLAYCSWLVQPAFLYNNLGPPTQE